MARPATGSVRCTMGSVRRQSGSSSAAAPVAPAVRSGHVRAVRGLEAAFVHGRGHDLDALFELWKPFYYRDLEAGGADREIAVEQHWAGYLSPWLSDHARKHGVGDQYCVEELHRLVVAELRAHLKAHQPEQTPPLPTGPVLLGELTIAEAVERYRIPKSTLARYVRQEMVPSHLGAAWNGRRTQAASALSTESLAHLALPRLVGDRAVVDRLSG